MIGSSPGDLADRFFRSTDRPRLLTFAALALLAVIALWGWAATGPNLLVAAIGFVAAAALGGVVWMRGTWTGLWTEPVQLFLVALDVRLLATCLGWGIKSKLGIVAANPDAVGYLYWAERIAAALPRALLDVRPPDMAATKEPLLHYLLGAALWLGGGDLLATQTVLAVLSALACIPLYVFVRAVAGRDGRLVAVVWALLPHAIYTGAGDFLKEPLFVLATFCVLAGAVRVSEAPRLDGPGFVGLVAGFVALRTTRSYVAIVLGALILVLALLERRRAKAEPGAKSAARSRSFLRVSAAILTAETLLVVAGFPLGVPYFFRGVTMAVGRPAAVQGTAGMADRALLPPTEAAKGTTGPAAVPSPARSESRILGAVRRLAGPYLWTPPTKDWLRLLVSGDIASWLSVPVWYFALAFGGFGILSLLRSGRWLSWLVAALCLVFGGVLVVFNMSFRQRDMILLPFLLLAAVVGWTEAGAGARRKVLAAAALALAVLAAAYWSLRLTGGG